MRRNAILTPVFTAVMCALAITVHPTHVTARKGENRDRIVSFKSTVHVAKAAKSIDEWQKSGHNSAFAAVSVDADVMFDTSRRNNGVIIRSQKELKTVPPKEEEKKKSISNEIDVSGKEGETLPDFWKSTLADIDLEIDNIESGEVSVITRSAGGLPVYVVAYGEKDDLFSQANYNSAVAAQNPAYYARKDSSTKPVALFLGPVHGQEVEGIVGLVNFIHILETGKDYRGENWNRLRQKAEACRVIIFPCANPDGRKRCPFDSFVAKPTILMTEYGQGTRRDGSLYGWPGAKAVHPMKGDVGILGAYFNDDGINPMHDDFFSMMATETKAILDVARSEAPDITVTLHSRENEPAVLQTRFIPMFMKKRITEFSRSVKTIYEANGLPYDRIHEPQIEDEELPLRYFFNLTSALHHVSGTMAFTFECTHGSISDEVPASLGNHEQILDIQLLLYEAMLDYIAKNRIYWILP